MIGGHRKSLLAGVNFDAEVALLVAVTLHVFDQDFNFPDRSLEDPITDKFVFALLRFQALEECWFSDYTINGQRNEYDPSLEKLKGRTDISFELGGLRRFIWECKLLHHKGSALYSEYRKKGVMRFITGKYAKGEPRGGMLGYVMDGDVSKAIAGVEKNLNDNEATVKLKRPCFDSCSDPADSRVFESHHNLGHDFLLYHGFLAFN